MWASGHKEMICSTTKGGAGVVAHEALADALGLTAFIVFPGMAGHPREGGRPVCRGSWSVGIGRSNLSAFIPPRSERLT